MPNGKNMTSTHTCNLDIPWIPTPVTEAHIVSGLAHASLISTRKFCEAGCKVIFDTKKCRLYYKGKLVLAGGKDNNMALWKLPIHPKTNPTPNKQGHHIESLNICTERGKHQSTLHTANAALYTLPYKKNQLNYMHQAFFNAPIKMLIDASLNNQLTGIPFINNIYNICKYLAPSPETPKGRMKKPKAGIRSTRKKHKSGGESKLGIYIVDSDSENENENTPTMPTSEIIPNDEPQ